MPYIREFINPQIFLNYKGVKVYHTYKHDEAEDNVSNYWYTTNPCPVNVDDHHSFFISELAPLTQAGKKLQDQPFPISPELRKRAEGGDSEAQTELKWAEEALDNWSKPGGRLELIFKEIMMEGIDKGLVENHNDPAAVCKLSDALTACDVVKIDGHFVGDTHIDTETGSVICLLADVPADSGLPEELTFENMDIDPDQAFYSPLTLFSISGGKNTLHRVELFELAQLRTARVVRQPQAPATGS